MQTLFILKLVTVNSLAGWHIPRKDLDLIKVVGHGEFGGMKKHNYFS